MTSRACLAALLALCACKDKRERKADDPMPMPEPTRDAAPGDAGAPLDAAAAWPELEGYPRTEPLRVVALPARPDVPRFDVGGPLLAGDVAVVASSQFGFVAVDWQRGAIAWSKPAGIRVAPPALVDGNVVLLGDCISPPQLPDGEHLVGCVRVVTPTGTDVAYLAIRARPAAIEPFAAARGAQSVWPAPDGRSVRWRRGDRAIAIDLLTGAAKPASATPPPFVVEYAGPVTKGQPTRWEIEHEGGRIVARSGGKPAWATEHSYTALLGPVYLRDMSPMLRLANASAFRDAPEIHLLDIDATGSLRAQAARPSPGISLLGWATSSIGDAALAVRLDTSLRRDFVVGYAANAFLAWVYPLPEIPRADPVGLAITHDGSVVVFHDGDTVSILPELSAPPTSPGATRAPSRNPTP